MDKAKMSQATKDSNQTSSVPQRTASCSKCGDNYPDGQPAACIRMYENIQDATVWKFQWVCRQCLASDWRYA
jgi:hypothetical protein